MRGSRWNNLNPNLKINCAFLNWLCFFLQPVKRMEHKFQVRSIYFVWFYIGKLWRSLPLSYAIIKMLAIILCTTYVFMFTVVSWSFSHYSCGSKIFVAIQGEHLYRLRDLKSLKKSGFRRKPRSSFQSRLQFRSDFESLIHVWKHTCKF